ncbi:unnamed protein product [Onchocerca flexuosa]|uniref:CCM2_C domain-containing protein n=1 Tax=Onchocerca flexuosa TaxID=387005 RepID=A0A183H2B7_9BILA|nr:unnamed protein product [Onchocerca flexuosa]
MTHNPLSATFTGSSSNCQCREYAGLVHDIRGDIDPSGRTDLLKILDLAKVFFSGNSKEYRNNRVSLLQITNQIESFDEKNKFTTNAILQIDLCSITVRSIFENELLLYVPIHLIASVGFVREAHEYILPVKVGYSSARNRDFFDLAVVYCETANVAETICNVLGQCFSQVYKEIASNFEASAAPKKTPTTSSVSLLNHRPLFLTESHQDLRISSGHPPCSTTASHSESAEVQIDDVVEDYMTVLTKCLTTNELSQYATLIVRFRNGSMSIIELAQKSSELYGPDRLHLLTVIQIYPSTLHCSVICLASTDVTHLLDYLCLKKIRIIGMRCLLRNRSKEEIESFDGFIEMLRLSNKGEVQKKNKG